MNRSGVYCEPVLVEDMLSFGDGRDHLLEPLLGSRRLEEELKDQGFMVNRKRVLRLMCVKYVSPHLPGA